MAPKVKVSAEDIVRAGLGLVRERGAGALNARALAEALNCSTQPIFSNFQSMEELTAEVMRSAHKLYLGFIKNEAESGKYPRYKAYGMAYIRFASDERELFKLLFMCDRRGADLQTTEDFDASVEMIMEANGVSLETARLMHLEMWTCVHGIAVMTATSFLSFEWDVISGMVTDIYQGLRLRHLSEVM